MSIHGVEAIARLANNERADIFQATAEQMGLPEAAVEKDFWVCWALQRIFRDNDLAKQLLFKGGTSLSKCYGLIERFSEDIDLILDWCLLTDEDPYSARSNTQQRKFNDAMESKARAYIQSTLLQQMTGLMGEYCRFDITAEAKPRSIMMTYPKSFSSNYIKPEIELEIGPMSAMLPNSEFPVRPYCANVVTHLYDTLDIKVKAIEAKKTFWDKVTILHVEAHRPADKDQPARYSRHYYDLYQMINSSVLAESMNDLQLLKDTIAFKDKFYPQGWANYEGATKGQFKLLPEDYRKQSLAKDYEQMKEMIFGEQPSFDAILNAIADFEQKLHKEYHQ